MSVLNETRPSDNPSSNMATLFNPQSGTLTDLLATWKANGGPSEDEKLEYVMGCADLLEDDEMQEKFKENVAQAATQANEIDELFAHVTRSFQAMVDEFGSDFPKLRELQSEWNGYNSVHFRTSLVSRRPQFVYRHGLHIFKHPEILPQYMPLP